MSQFELHYKTNTSVFQFKEFVTAKTVEEAISKLKDNVSNLQLVNRDGRQVLVDQVFFCVER